jgi:hypothetical protein
MGDEMPQVTRALASDMAELDAVAEIVDHNGSTGKVSFRVSEDHALSERKVLRLLPDHCTKKLVITDNDYTNVFISG